MIINFIKKCCQYSRNLIVWLTPIILFCTVLFIVAISLGSDLVQYIELLKVVIWPATVLIALFFFRKVVTYLFFSMDEFNFFGVKGDLKNVRQLIDEEVQKQFEKEKKENSEKKKFQVLEKKIDVKTNSAEESRKIARDMYELYISYKKSTDEQIKKLVEENRSLNEIHKFVREGGVSPSIENTTTISDLGTGGELSNLQGIEP